MQKVRNGQEKEFKVELNKTCSGQFKALRLVVILPRKIFSIEAQIEKNLMNFSKMAKKQEFVCTICCLY